MILVDTTVWIDLFNGQGSAQVLKLEDLIGNRADLCTCGAILTEVLQGIRNETEFQRIMEVANRIFIPVGKTITFH